MVQAPVSMDTNPEPKQVRSRIKRDIIRLVILIGLAIITTVLAALVAQVYGV